MASKKDKFAQALKGQPAKLEGVSKRGWKVIALGIGIVIAGFIVLSFTDPGGRNWASNLSPFLILGGYAVIGMGIVLPDHARPQGPSTEVLHHG